MNSPTTHPCTGSPARRRIGRCTIAALAIPFLFAFALARLLAPTAATASPAGVGPADTALIADPIAPIAIGVVPTMPPPEWRTWLSMGPYRPPADPGHWVDPRGTGVLVLGAGVHTAAAPTMTLGLEGVAWLASYALPAGTQGRAGSRLRGAFVGLGPVVKARFVHGRWEPTASATLLLVRSHMTCPSGLVAPSGDVEIEDAWRGTLALAAGVGLRSWRWGGLAARYEFVPLSTSFGVLSNGSADVGISTVMLSVYHDLAMPLRHARGRDAERNR